MSPAYTVVEVEADPAQQEIVVALLSELGYEGFWETETHLSAYRRTEGFDPDALADALAVVGPPPYRHRPVPPENWNALWEANYPSVSVAGFVHLHPSHRPPEPGYPIALAIDPKMSFGTGHHATTVLMLEWLQALSSTVPGAQVLDMGCGTGLLGLVAARLGAAHVTLIDIEPWAIENTREHLVRNGVSAAAATVRLGDATALGPEDGFDLILANIQRNVLLADLPTYTRHLRPGGTLVVSGFFDFDRPVLEEKFNALGYRLHPPRIRDGWCALAGSLPPAR